MSLLSSFNEKNQVTHTALQVKYAVESEKLTLMGWHEKESGLSAYEPYDILYYRCRRFATKSYDYVGMDYNTALCCQQKKIEQYTRDYSKIMLLDAVDEGQSNLSTSTSKYCGAEIACTHIDGGMWNVNIRVNEEDEKPSLTVPTNLPALFASENARQYDELSVYTRR